VTEAEVQRERAERAERAEAHAMRQAAFARMPADGPSPGATAAAWNGERRSRR
jgi:hypothetical protein